jgi:recombination protein RecR
MNYPPSIQKLIDIFSKFPSVGSRTATRFVFYLLNQDKNFIKQLVISILGLKKNIKICKFCFKPFEISESSTSLCEICSDPNRDKNLLCIVPTEIELFTIESTKKYQGRYFILGGTLPPIKKANIENLRIKELKKILKENPEIKEVILAFNFNVEGESTIFYLKKILKPFSVKITRLGKGLPIGGEIEYADEETLFFALKNREEV